MFLCFLQWCFHIWYLHSHNFLFYCFTLAVKNSKWTVSGGQASVEVQCCNNRYSGVKVRQQYSLIYCVGKFDCSADNKPQPELIYEQEVMLMIIFILTASQYNCKHVHVVLLPTHLLHIYPYIYKSSLLIGSD